MAKMNFSNDMLQISDDVISKIAINEATSVDGVCCAGDDLVRDIGAFILNKTSTKGVKIERTNEIINISLFVNLKYDLNIPNTASEIQKRVKKTVEDITNLPVGFVNVNVVGIHKIEEDEVSL